MHWGGEHGRIELCRPRSPQPAPSHAVQHRGRTGSPAAVQRCSEDVAAAWTAAPACPQGGEGLAWDGAEHPSPQRHRLKETMPGLASTPPLLIVPLQGAQEPQPSKTWSRSAAVPGFWSRCLPPSGDSPRPLTLQSPTALCYEAAAFS